ncbi:DUF4259 domain-containing protein [Chitinophaga defluvii]|uniref:DUF4259 domain-containing protein n=1 Tax=Chitinophaga defluvii TaxID=3163343 RepID=A0ABV2T0U1_9BACT
MGAWGTRNFENDGSQDWIFDLMDNKDAGMVSDTLARVLNNNENLEISDCEEALAAAEVVAALAGKPSEDIPEDPLDTLDVLNIIVTSSLRQQAIATVQKIQTASEMKAQWEDQGQAEAWNGVLNNLVQRLKI